MYSDMIEKSIGILNVAAALAMATFAVFGIFTLFFKNTRLNIFRNRAFLSGFCAAALFAFAVEFTFFNIHWYQRFFSDPGLTTMGVSSSDSTVVLTSDGSSAAITEKKIGNAKLRGIAFKNLDRRITSIYVDCTLGEDRGESVEMLVERQDAEALRQFKKRIYKRLPFENHTPVYASGKVSELRIMFPSNRSGEPLAINSITLNKPIPMYVSGLRLVVTSLLMFAFILFINKKLRVRASYYLFDYKFDPANKRQRSVYAASVAALVFFSAVSVYTSVSTDMERMSSRRQYNRYLVDALIAGKTYLDFGNLEKLDNAAGDPYDPTWRTRNNRSHKENEDWMWDCAYYEGKHYSYYGVVPAVILFVPFKLITGVYLYNHAGVIVFTVIFVVLLAALWRFCVKKYMPNSTFAFLLLSLLTLFFASGLFAVLRYPTIYTIAQASAFMFTAAGLLLLLKSVDGDRVDRAKLFFACLCLALVAGCRPNIVFVSLLVPVILWKHRSWKLLPVVMIPYVIVAIPLCAYNYVRFGSIFEFGAKYCLTSINGAAYGMLSPAGHLMRMGMTYASYLFQINKYSYMFPFVECFPRHSFMGAHNILQYNQSGAGIINFPIVICLPLMVKYIFSKVRPMGFGVMLGFAAAAAVITAPYPLMVGFQGRYIFDFFLFILIPSLFCAYHYCRDTDCLPLRRTRMKAVYVLCAVSAFVGAALFVTGGATVFYHRDPILYKYLEYSLGLIRF